MEMHLVAELRDYATHLAVERTIVGPQGSFEFRNVNEGDYELRILTEFGETVTQQQITVRPMNDTITIRLNLPRSERPPSGRISLARLQHKVPKKAQKEYEKAQARLQAHDIDGSLLHLQTAVSLDPDFMEAYNNLGCRYLELGRYQQAITAFRQSLKLDESVGFTHSNLALALLQVRDFSGAEISARRGLELEPDSSKAHYALGLVLYVQHKLTRETLGHLRRSEDAFPNSRIAAANVLLALGSVAEARNELTPYLSTGDPGKRKEVERWLSTLK